MDRGEIDSRSDLSSDLNQKDNTSSSVTKACNSPNKYEIIATPINGQYFGESTKSIISSKDNVKSILDHNIDLDIENIDINNLQVIEKVGDAFFEKASPSLIPTTGITRISGWHRVSSAFCVECFQYHRRKCKIVNLLLGEKRKENIVLNINSINLNHRESFPISNQDIPISSDTQDPISDILIHEWFRDLVVEQGGSPITLLLEISSRIYLIS
ncbi:hypothetical protein WA026_015792 [Henosepilachna vigintioctopunctata]|uniref:Uncharacterized protein n=1 Tax=Henosepilachna vigintioctopunctata TaxID=420089 RepID=A0AAW1UZG5_9CUCU